MIEEKKLAKILFSGNGYGIYDMNTRDRGSAFLYGYKERCVIWFQGLNYWEGEVLYEDFNISLWGEGDFLGNHVRDLHIPTDRIVVIDSGTYTHFIGCNAVAVWRLQDDQSIPNTIDWFNHDSWDVLWRSRELMPNVVVYGWEEGFKTISFVKLLMQSANTGLKEAADIRDCVVAHQEVSFSFETEEAAQAFVRDVVALGGLARVEASMPE